MKTREWLAVEHLLTSGLVIRKSQIGAKSEKADNPFCKKMEINAKNKKTKQNKKNL